MQVNATAADTQFSQTDTTTTEASLKWETVEAIRRSREVTEDIRIKLSKPKKCNRFKESAVAEAQQLNLQFRCCGFINETPKDGSKCLNNC